MSHTIFCRVCLNSECHLFEIPATFCLLEFELYILYGLCSMQFNMELAGREKISEVDCDDDMHMDLVYGVCRIDILDIGTPYGCETQRERVTVMIRLQS